MSIQVIDKPVVPQPVRIFDDRWALTSMAAQQVQVDGRLEETVWRRAGAMTGSFVTVYDNIQSDVRTALAVSYDESKLYIALTGDNAATAAEADQIDVLVQPHGSNVYYKLPIPLKQGIAISADYGPGGVTIGDYQLAAAPLQDGWSVEAAVPLSSLGVTGITPGEEWKLNAIRHQPGGARTSSWFPLGTSTFWVNDNGSYSFLSYAAPEGRWGRMFAGIGTSSQVWRPARSELLYTGFLSKELRLQQSDHPLELSTLRLSWVTPDGDSIPIVSPEAALNGSEIRIRFSHPAATRPGMYQLRIDAQEINSGLIRTALLAFDREALIAAGEGSVNYPLPADRSLSPVPLAPASSAVQKLLDLIPDKQGFYWAGLPDNPDLRPINLYTWSPDEPDRLRSPNSSRVYPITDKNEPYYEDQVLKATNAKGETVEYPYYEDSSGKRYFVTAHLWYKQRQYVLGQVERIAAADPLGAARILNRLAEVYEGYVPLYDTVWKTWPLDSSSGPPYTYWGGMWDYWYFMDLTALLKLTDAFNLIKKTDAFREAVYGKGHRCL